MFFIVGIENPDLFVIVTETLSPQRTRRASPTFRRFTGFDCDEARNECALPGAPGNVSQWTHIEYGVHVPFSGKSERAEANAVYNA
jgi:hypothetical protein